MLKSGSYSPTAETARVVNDDLQAAPNATGAGFDGVELHGTTAIFSSG